MSGFTTTSESVRIFVVLFTIVCLCTPSLKADVLIYNSSDVPKNIRDADITTSSLTISAVSGQIPDLNVKLNLTHSQISQLAVYLESPTGHQVLLFDGVGSDSNNFTNTVLDDEADVTIESGTAPFTGSYRPQGSLADFDGQLIAGTWTLWIYDTNPGETGILDSWSLIVGIPGQIEFDSTDVPKDINDPGLVKSAGTIDAQPYDTQSCIIADLDVKLDLTHTADSDLDLYLENPTGNMVRLFAAVGSDGDNFTNTVLDDEAATSIESGKAPFTGSYRPQGSLADFDGASISGTWTLWIYDNNTPNTGTLNSWSLDFILATVLEYNSPDVPKDINGLETHSSTLTIHKSFQIADLDVKLNIDHSFDEDLNVFLLGPDGTIIELFTDVGGADANFSDTILDDEAPGSITLGTAPFAGSFRPEASLSHFDGKNARGTWSLLIDDDFPAADDGTLNSWSLHFEVPPYVGDLYVDEIVNLYDYAVLTAAWQTGRGDPGFNDICDLNEPKDNRIDALDLKEFLGYWLAKRRP